MRIACEKTLSFDRFQAEISFTSCFSQIQVIQSTEVSAFEAIQSINMKKVYSSSLQLDLDEVEPCISGPKRPHDRVPLKEMKADWEFCLKNKVGFKSFAIPKKAQDKVAKFLFHGQTAELNHGSVVIAAFTYSPSVMLGVALAAKKACELGLEVIPWVKTIHASGSGHKILGTKM